MKKHLNKICVFLVIISILCTALFSGCSKKASVSVNESESNSASVSENNKDTAKSGNHKEDSPAIEENSSVLNKEMETEKTTKDKYNKESTTKPVGKETTTKVKAKEPTTAAYTPKPLVPLTAEQERKIKQDYLAHMIKISENTIDAGEYDEKTVEDVNLKRYLGSYNDCIVVLIELFGDIFMCAPKTEIIAGYQFDYSYITTIEVCFNGNFIALATAYENGLISKEDMRNIHYYYNNGI